MVIDDQQNVGGIVRTAVNPHRGRKQIIFSDVFVGTRVRTAVNPHRGRKLSADRPAKNRGVRQNGRKSSSGTETKLSRG